MDITLYYFHNSILVSKIVGVANFVAYEAMDPVAIVATATLSASGPKQTPHSMIFQHDRIFKGPSG
jgi:hypothetical protein